MSKSKLSEFRPQARNANKGNQAGIRELDKSIRRDGYSAPMVAAADGEIFAGSKRLERAADVFGLDVEPIIVESDGTRPVIHVRRDIPNANDPRAVRLGVADNAIASADWNPDGEVLALLAAEDEFIAELVKADEKAAKALLEYTSGQAGTGDAEPQTDRETELQKKWQVVTGDLWAIGQHRLLCGDSTKREDVERVMEGEKAGACITDPPYGMNLDVAASDLGRGDSSRVSQRPRNYDPVFGDDKPFDPGFLFVFWQAPEMFLWGADYYAEKIPNRVSGSWLVWDKRDGIENSEFSTSSFELCWSKEKHRRDVIRKRWAGVLGMESQDTAIRFHPTQKPTEIFEWIISRYTKKGEIVSDPFAGSGTTLVACQNLARRCRAIEISPAYCAVILQRMQDAFGVTGELIGGNSESSNGVKRKGGSN